MPAASARTGAGAPIQWSAAEHCVELGGERQPPPVAGAHVETPSRRCRDHRPVGVDPDHRRPRADQSLGQDAVAAAEIEDALARRWRKQVEHGSAQRWHERRVRRVCGRVPRHSYRLATNVL